MTGAVDNRLLSHRLRNLVRRIEEDPDAAPRRWEEADALLAETESEEEADLALPVWERDLGTVKALLQAWDDGSAPLPAWDHAVLKRAYKAYKKRLKLVRLDDVSTSGGNPLSQGKESTILGVRPPDQYRPEVWALLVRQGTLVEGPDGLLEIPGPGL